MTTCEMVIIELANLKVVWECSECKTQHKATVNFVKHLQEQQHPLAELHINQGSMDAAADAYEAEYNAAQKAEMRRAEFDAEMRLDAYGPVHG